MEANSPLKSNGQARDVSRIEACDEFTGTGIFPDVRRLWILIGLGCAIASAGCHRIPILPMEPPQVTVAEMEPSGRPAKDPNCAMPVLYAEPLADYRKVAIIDALGAPSLEEKDLLPVIKRKACETGADALVIVTSKAQHSETPAGMVAGGQTGYYISAVAINYVAHGAPASTPHKP